jgi:hypothetical protein
MAVCAAHFAGMDQARRQGTTFVSCIDMVCVGICYATCMA